MGPTTTARWICCGRGSLAAATLRVAPTATLKRALGKAARKEESTTAAVKEEAAGTTTMKAVKEQELLGGSHLRRHCRRRCGPCVVPLQTVPSC
jgi:hypothetical protein